MSGLQIFEECVRNWIVRVVHISEKQEDIQSEDGQGHQLMGKTLQFDFCILNRALFTFLTGFWNL